MAAVARSRISTKHTILRAFHTKHTTFTFPVLATHKENSSDAEYRREYRLGESLKSGLAHWKLDILMVIHN